MQLLSFITKENLITHINETIKKYDEKLQAFDLKHFNRNIIDPIKLIFDKTIYGLTWEDIIKNEIFRQRDKSNTNDIGYFHQNIFKYIDRCEVPINGWDIIYKNENGIMLPCGTSVNTIYVELKNKHNTMNNSSASKTFMKMQNQILHDDNCACFLVEAIAKKSQNITWTTTVDNKKIAHKLIRRVSLDEFYSMVTGEEDAFYQLCMILPEMIKEALLSQDTSITPKDTVMEELEYIALQDTTLEKDISLLIAIYMLGFNSYKGFVDKYVK